MKMAASVAPPIVSLHGAGVRFGTREALSGVSLSIARSEFVAVVGANGAGKTTLLRALHGLLPLTAGDRRVAPGGPRITMLFQRPFLVRMSVLGNLKLALWLAGVPRRERLGRAEEALARAGLAAEARRQARELSVGQQQRIALARALAPRPDLLLLDEPFSNLDVEFRAQLSVEVREILKQQNTTAILVTHDQHEAFNLADEIGIMRDGAIEQWDTPYRLYHEPVSRYVAEFVGQGVFLPGTVLAPGHIRLELGVFQASTSDWPQGTEVDVLLRPDDILHDDASPLQAQVLHKAFRGAEFLYTLQLLGGGRVMSLVPSHHNHAIGEKIGIRLEIDHLVAFGRETAQAR